MKRPEPGPFCLSIALLSPGTAAPAAIRKPAMHSLTPAVTARPSRDLRCSAPTWKSSLPCCIRITARISALNRPCTRSLTVRDRRFSDAESLHERGADRHFPTTELSQIGDETADRIYHPAEFSPLSHFDAAVSISRWHACATTPAPQPNISSRSCCLPITPAMWTNLSAGAVARSSIRTAHPHRPLLRGQDLDHRRNRSTGRGHLRPGVEKAPDASLAPDHRRRSGHYAD